MFADAYKAAGVALTESFGTAYPSWFTHPLAEYEALTGNVGLIDLTHWGVLRLTGEDRVTFLNSMITNDVSSLADGQACHAALTTIKGKLVAELFVLRREEDLVVLVAQGDRARVVESLTKHIIADDVSVSDETARWGVLSVEGPKARDLVWRLLPDAPLPMESLAFIDTDYQDAPLTVLRNSVTGERGFQLIVGADDIERIRTYVVQGGRGMDMALCGRVAWNMRRVEQGLPWFGEDVGEDNFPKETRLDDVVSYSKGCFLGQETLARMHHRGHPNWLLVGLAPAGDAPAALRYPTDPQAPAEAFDFTAVPAGTEMFARGDADRAVGRVTSAAFSPAASASRFLGFVRATLSETGTRFDAELAGSRVQLEIITLPIEGDTT